MALNKNNPYTYLCDWCKVEVGTEHAWLVKHFRTTEFFTPNNQVTEKSVTQDEWLHFCTKSHRNEYLYGF